MTLLDQLGLNKRLFWWSCLLLVGWLVLMLFSGCSAGRAIVGLPPASLGPLPLPRDDVTAIPIPLFMTIGVLACTAGAFVGMFTKFATGLGMALIGTGFFMITLGWFFSQPWAPWTALITLLIFAGYKVWLKFFQRDTEEGLFD
jgi:hypothetical protein